MFAKIKDTFFSFKTKAGLYVDLAKEKFGFLREYFLILKGKVLEQVEIAKNDRVERKRILILFFTSIFLLDYLMLCYHIDKNIFDIFPSIPQLDIRKEITVYLPSLDGKTLMPEKRLIPGFESDKRFAEYLCTTVKKGSRYENTALVVPVDIFVTEIWLYHESPDEVHCVFDIEPATLTTGKSIKIIPGSEALFREALEKTVTENIPAIKKVTVLEKGIPAKRLWEL